MKDVRGTVAAQHACPEEACGKPRTGPGRVPNGWVQVRLAATSDPAPWFCSWHCVSRHAIRRELAEGRT
jgi:hypothetical protein